MDVTALSLFSRTRTSTRPSASPPTAFVFLPLISAARAVTAANKKRTARRKRMILSSRGKQFLRQTERCRILHLLCLAQAAGGGRQESDRSPVLHFPFIHPWRLPGVRSPMSEIQNPTARTRVVR